jgi:flagellar hook-associated protein 3 FlgL
MGGVLKGQERVQKSNEHLITNKKLLTAADGPSDMSKTMFLSSEIKLTEQHLKNGMALENVLTLQEGLLGGIVSSAHRARVLGVQSGDGINETQERKSISNELRQIREQVLDLMNSRDANGNSVFSGHQSSVSPYHFDGSNYVYQGDDGKIDAKISASVYVQSNINGYEAFENVAKRLTASSDSENLNVRVLSQGTFDDFHQSYYDSFDATKNVFSIQTLVGPPDTYQVLDSESNILAQGAYEEGAAVSFKGLELKLNGPVGSSAESFSLDFPKKENILNTLTDFINMLEDSSVQYDDYNDAQRDFLVGIDNSLETIGLAMGQIGARGNSLNSVRDASSSIDLINQKSRADLSESDIAEAASELSKAELALNSSYSTYSKVSQLSLFNYL